MHKVKSSILFLIFNRPKETQVVFNSIRLARPRKLYVAADGPRSNEKDYVTCSKTRDILSQIDWDCELITLFREQNLGCGIAVSSAISWFFEQEEEGIVLEDDCAPTNDFFRFCDLMLDRYREDNRVGHICGCNFQDGIWRGDGDYYYSNLTNVWGWASWRRVWLKYDFNMTHLEVAKESGFLFKISNRRNFREFVYKNFKRTKDGHIDTWDYQYFYSNLINGYLSIIPNNNMISNIGFGREATHTRDVKSPYANLKVFPIKGSVNSPLMFVSNMKADDYSLGNEIPNSFELVILDLKHLIRLLLVKVFKANKSL
jgi:hypothetical protein